MKEIVVASRNEGKVREIMEVLNGLPFKITCLSDYPHIPEVIEDAKTYRGNALKKAREVARATGKMAISDDSGLEVKALKGAPGIYSARFAGKGASEKAKNKKLFKMLENVPFARRQARYRCLIALVDEQGRELGVVQGICSGFIATEARGKNGFGFDPLFWLKRYGKTFGELPPEVKARISHRARAIKKLRLLLDRL